MVGAGSGTRTRSPARRRFAVLASLSVVAVFTAASAQAAQATDEDVRQHCVLDTASQQRTCYDSFSAATGAGQRIADTSGSVIGATVFEDAEYGGASLTITVPEPCPKNDEVDFWLDLDDSWKNRISSVQAWSTCWVWLYPDSGDRAGPYKEKAPRLNSGINDRTVTVGLS
ncbi:hypothetical protein FHR84_003783 [Actinopolyspora biskrensis]|uniref:Peptidase inhibitor family I36 n=1 Tax=Actinopolyspora biskrensis TaxID=1470178 RepID=A0A852ZA67_9ACTN|nr:hypothetical protein [Actinopolyspora biskrensis]NYH80426.1 hypothetical protein [Actinopolyspora biskrensis]